MLASLLTILTGAALVAIAVRSAVRTFVLPRGASDPVTGLVFRSLRRLFRLRARAERSYEGRDRVMAMYAPVSLVCLPVAWLILVITGYLLIFWALGIRPWREALLMSGSSLFTLGFHRPESLLATILTFSEAVIGLGLIALLVSYLPTMYTAFSRREQVVALLEVRAGSPPSAVEMIERAHRLDWVAHLDEQFLVWEQWFVDLEESHTSLAALVFFRSPQPDRSWVTAGGAVLDAAALVSSTLDRPRAPGAELCIRAGYIALRRVAAYFRIPFDADPAPTDPISITRAEFDAACEHLASVGVPLKPDRDQAWRDFAGWRVNYDSVLLDLAALTMAPYAPWSSDRVRQAQ